MRSDLPALCKEGSLCVQGADTLTFRAMDFVRRQGRKVFLRITLMAALHDAFCSLARKERFVCRECTLRYSTEIQSAPDAARGQKAHAARPSIKHWRQDADHP